MLRTVSIDSTSSKVSVAFSLDILIRHHSGSHAVWWFPVRWIFFRVLGSWGNRKGREPQVKSLKEWGCGFQRCGNCPHLSKGHSVVNSDHVTLTNKLYVFVHLKHHYFCFFFLLGCVLLVVIFSSFLTLSFSGALNSERIGIKEYATKRCTLNVYWYLSLLGHLKDC